MTCPICEKPSDSKYKPFCSRRCADIDLAKWMNGNYAIPSQSPDAFDEVAEELEQLADTGQKADPEKLH